MNILSSALPGIREVRAPLVAGYLWLLLLWLICDPGKDFTNVHGTAAEVVDLCRTAGPIATALGVSVAAYLIGALSHPLASVLGSVGRSALGRFGVWLARRLSRPVPAPALQVRSSVRARSEEWEREAIAAVIVQYFSQPVAENLRRVLSRRLQDPMTLAAAWEVLDSLIRAEEGFPEQFTEMTAAKLEIREYDSQLITRTWRTCTLSTEAIDGDILRAARLYHALPDDRRDELWAQLVWTSRALADEAERQLSIPATLLVGDQPLPFAQADRDRAEAELRIDVALPMAVLSVYLAFTASVAWVGGLAAVVALLWQGLMSEDASKRLIVETLHHKKIPITAFEKFSRAVTEAEEEANR